MCLGYPARILQIDHHNALVETMGVQTNISVELMENPAVGDYVMVHAGIAISKMQKQDAEETLTLLKELESYEDEAL